MQPIEFGFFHSKTCILNFNKLCKLQHEYDDQFQQWTKTFFSTKSCCNKFVFPTKKCKNQWSWQKLLFKQNERKWSLTHLGFEKYKHSASCSYDWFAFSTSQKWREVLWFWWWRFCGLQNFRKKAQLLLLYISQIYI